MSELVIRHTPGVTTCGPFRLTAVGLEADGAPSFEDWQRAGLYLQQTAGAVQWWVGDWLNYGERRYGEMYAQAMDATGMDYQSVADVKWATSRFDSSRRREKVSFTTHREVAALDPAQADAILDRAEAEGLSTRAVRQLVRRAKHAKPDRGFDPSAERDVILNWLLARRDSWPEEFRGEFVGFVTRVFKLLEELDVDHGGGGQGSADAGGGPA